MSWNDVDTPGNVVPPQVTILDGVRWGFGIFCAGRSRVGANVRGGVGGDKFEVDGVQGDEPVCVGQEDVAIPGPAGVTLLVAGALGALVYTRRARRLATSLR